MGLHYAIVVLIIIAIIGLQLSIFINTKRKIGVFKSIFPSSRSSYSIKNITFIDAQKSNTEDEDEDSKDSHTVTVSQINIKTQNPTLKEIITALNMYLKKNKGAASDFYLMKDVVERYCDAEEEEISIQQPIPLYLGLMGTMVGIIIGIGFIAISGGLSSESLMNNITSLMTCVAIAMAASFVGILCTTLLSWSSKSANSKVEADKNHFYSWLQTELLPTLSGNAINALYLLQQNLMTFNQTFQTNIEGLSSALSKVKDSTGEQIELINLIRNIDIKKVAQANVTVLKELKECTGEIEVFNKYLHNVSGYLESVNELNGNINEHLNRTATIEKMGVFFEKEINQVSAREKYIYEVVSKVDNTLHKTFESISESTKKSLNELYDNSTREFNALQKHYFTQKEEFAKMLQQQQEEFLGKSAEATELIKEIRNFADAKAVMGQLLESIQSQTAMLGKLANGINGMKSSNDSTEYLNNDNFSKGSANFPKSIVYMMVIITFMAVSAFGLYVYNSFIAKPIVTSQTTIQPTRSLQNSIDNKDVVTNFNK